MNTGNLESKFWYRLLKVVYILGWLVVVLNPIITYEITKPNGSVIIEKSGFICPNGKSYLWTSNSGIYHIYSKSDTYLNNDDNISALTTCGLYTSDYLLHKSKDNLLTNQNCPIFDTEKGCLDTFLTPAANAISKNPPYKLFWVTDETSEKNIQSIGAAIISFFVGYLLLDTTKNIVLYIILGQRFSYPFLHALFYSSRRTKDI